MGFCLYDFKSSCIASHVHFNYIFMHYRCVLYMLNCCVLLGLDWAEPMMFLKLHVTCSCIRTSFFYHFHINCVWCFSACLSLSFFLSVSCSMAPKRKSTSSWNPLCSGASSPSSPSDPTPSHVRFCDDKVRKDFLENFSR